MHAAEWERIKVVFDSALNLPESARPAYLEKACETCPEMRATVVELLASHDAAPGFLEEVSVRLGPAFAEGDLVGSRFRIVRLISRGGMGEVYEAFDEKLRVRCALKTLRPQLAHDEEALKRFQREILLAHEVSHEGLCRVFDLVEHRIPGDDERIIPCLSMQLIEGESLADLLRRERPLEASVALSLIRQAAGAIEALHSKGIVHRDLKPSNVMIAKTPGGALRAIVTDFGLAKDLENRLDLFESRLDFQAGAPYFMAPELLRGEAPSAASDIYSFGLLLDEMVTSSCAFPAESVQSLYYDKLWGKPLLPSTRSPGLPPGWEAVILRCLDPDPSRRFLSVADAVAGLESEPAGVPTPVPAATPAYLSPERPPSRNPGIRRASAVVLALLSVALASAAFLRPIHASVMVFPIDNLTGNRDYDYLCKGTNAELMRRLALLDGIRVIPYYETRSRLDRPITDAQFSLVGLLQASGDRVRLTEQLTDNRTGRLLWSRNFENQMSNPLDLQSGIADGSIKALESEALFGSSGDMMAAVASSWRPLRRLLRFQSTAAARVPTVSNVAFDRYIRGRSLLEERTVPATLAAIQSFEGALAEDPSFALAEAALADSQFPLLDYDYAPTAELMARARQYAEKAVQLGPDLAETWASLAAVQQTQWNFADAENSYRESLRLNPNSSRTHRWYAGLVMQFGRFDDGLREAQVANELDPYDLPGEAAHCLYLYFARKYAEAIPRLKKVLERRDLVAVHLQLADIFIAQALADPANRSSLLKHAMEEADIVEQKIRSVAPAAPAPRTPVSVRYADRLHAEIYSLLGDRAAAQPFLDRLTSDAANGRTSTIGLAIALCIAGENEKAIDWLQTAVSRRDRQLLYTKVSPQFDSLRGEPRFRDIIASIGL